MYIGKEPIVGNFQKCDAISVVNGQAAYTLQVSSTNVVPESANHMLVSLNGILQAPVTSFTVSGSTLTFASNLATGAVIDFVILLGNVLDLGTPSDGTVTNAKLGTDVISGETDIGGAIADADIFLLDNGAGGTLRKTAASRIKTYVGGGKIGQVVSTTKTDTTSVTQSSSYADISGMSVDITPSATSSKILVFVSCYPATETGYNCLIKLVRGSTDICIGDAASSRSRVSTGTRPHSTYDIAARTINYLDSPSTTSSTTYKLQWRQVDNTTAYLNRSYNDADDQHRPRLASTITVMEVLA